eukprot:199202-Hanusia_phi.AAC.8
MRGTRGPAAMTIKAWAAVALAAMHAADAFQLTGYSQCRPMAPASQACSSFLGLTPRAAVSSLRCGTSPQQKSGNVKTDLRMAGAVESVNAEAFELIVQVAEDSPLPFPSRNRSLIFEQEETKPLVVDFYAEWCGPCRLVAPQLEEVAQGMKDQVRFLKVNTDENEKLATIMQVRLS